MARNKKTNTLSRMGISPLELAYILMLALGLVLSLVLVSKKQQLESSAYQNRQLQRIQQTGR